VSEAELLFLMNTPRARAHKGHGDIIIKVGIIQSAENLFARPQKPSGFEDQIYFSAMSLQKVVT